MSHKLNQSNRSLLWSVFVLLISILGNVQYRNSRNHGISVVVVVQAFPSGAGGCMGNNMAAVGGTHTMPTDGRVITNNTLQEGDVTVTIIDPINTSSNTGIALRTDTPADVLSSMDYTIQVTSPAFPLRGILIRVEVPESEDAISTVQLLPGIDTQNAIACTAPILGTTHIDASDKNEMTSTLRSETPVNNVILDITGVFLNGPTGSVYVYSRYIINFLSNDTNETMVPTAPPTTLPIVAPTISPTTVSPTTAAPITMTPTTSSPVDVVTEAPVVVPTTTIPTVTPTMMMDIPSTVPINVLFPSDVPTIVTDIPVSMETDLPTTSIVPTVEPSLRGGKGMGSGGGSSGMGMGKGGGGDDDKGGSMMSSGKGSMGSDKGGMMSNGKGGGKGTKQDMKKSKDEDDKYPMSKISKKEKEA